MIDADISKFFGTLDKAVLGDFFDQRIGAGILEQGTLHYPEQVRRKAG